MTKHKGLVIGATTITRVHELDLNDFEATQLLPGLNPETIKAHPEWADSQVYDSDSGRVCLSIHTWLVRHMGKNLLIDTGAGNGKSRPQLKVLDHLQNPYLEGLAACGVHPQDIDYILLTHIHADHVGWNTRWVDQSWVPTFPNATVICSDLEWRYGAALTAGDQDTVAALRKEAGFGEAERVPAPGVFTDSMAPLVATGRIQCIRVDGGEVLKGVRFLPCAGHSIDHAAISIASEGEEAVFGGDIVHHPFELYMPQLTSMFCEFPDAARQARLKIATHVVRNNAIYCSSHFPASSAGRITQEGSAFGWSFASSEESVSVGH